MMLLCLRNAELILKVCLFMSFEKVFGKVRGLDTRGLLSELNAGIGFENK